MRFPKAHSGLKKIFVSELLQIFGGVLAVTAATLVAISLEPLQIAGGSVALAASIIAIVAFVLQMVGLFQANKDAGQFMIAFWIVVIAIVADVLVPVLNKWVPGSGPVASAIGVIAGASAILALLFTIFGIMNLADSLGDKSMKEAGRKLAFFVVILYAISILFKLFPSFFNDPNNILSIIFSILAIAAAIAELIAYILTLVYYARAIKMTNK